MLYSTWARIVERILKFDNQLNYYRLARVKHFFAGTKNQWSFPTENSHRPSIPLSTQNLIKNANTCNGLLA